MSATPSPDSPVPAYLQVAEALATRIEADEFELRLPSERVLTREYGCSYDTLRHAMRVLRGRELIITRHGYGTFVKAAVRAAGLI
jgi:GntR family transcriptional regulator